ncbi:hypothetical protein [Helicobacter sp. 11S02629-2]|uniref:hypothetical protein n=1 Tax=Helicobacter sp. 11S02629-2 TaxID=1476195 RepID=UPI000BA56509|nr:hypothetical protein [Helicobacter sp. 11S02629-2]PAF44164.1 hypothetical protein BKH40_06095 [Helicobacter sp. 11S02629-2]
MINIRALINASSNKAQFDALVRDSKNNTDIKAESFKIDVENLKNQASDKSSTKAPSLQDKLKTLTDKEKTTKQAKPFSPSELDKIVKIDKYIFSARHGIDSLSTAYTLGIKKFDTLERPYYIAIGGDEVRVSFALSLLCDDIEYINGFKALVLKKEPLNFSTLQSTESKKILIDSFTYKYSRFSKDANKNSTFLELDVDINGILL